MPNWSMSGGVCRSSLAILPACPLRHRLMTLLATCLLAPLSVVAADEPTSSGVVTCVVNGATARFAVDGDEVTTWRFEPGQAKPFLSPVRTAQGVVVTRQIGDPVDNDHPHHKGIWLAVDEVGESKHWMEREHITNQSLEVLQSGRPRATLRVVNHWLDAHGEPQLIERTDITCTADRTLEFDIHFSPAGEQPVTFHDTKEGLFGLRMASELREKVGGQVTNSRGEAGTAKCWGQPADWVDYSGVIQGQACGVAIFDHPGNFRPSRYHVRDYGLFTISPFGEGAYQNDPARAQPVTIAPHEELRLRYALAIHDGDAQQADIAGRFARYAQTTSP